MYRIAICDDDASYIEYISEKLDTYLTKESYVIDKYLSGKLFIENLNNGYNLIFLDYQLDDIEGIYIARELRKYDNKSILVFCTGVKDPEASFFKVNPYRYLMKSMDDVDFSQEIREIIEYMLLSNKIRFVAIRVPRGVETVDLKNILYVQKSRNGCNIVHYDKKHIETKCTRSLNRIDELFLKINDELNFGFASTSYFICYRNVSDIKEEQVYLKNGEKLCISRSKRKSFISGYISYCSRKYGDY